MSELNVAVIHPPSSDRPAPLTWGWAWGGRSALFTADGGRSGPGERGAEEPPSWGGEGGAGSDPGAPTNPRPTRRRKGGKGQGDEGSR